MGDNSISNLYLNKLNKNYFLADFSMYESEIKKS